MVKTTRRERFMGSPAAAHLKSFGQAKRSHSSADIQALAFKLCIEADLRSTGKPKPAVSQDRADHRRLVFLVSRRRKNAT
jgi:hypothetical protein